jgi:hypothetical protein
VLALEDDEGWNRPPRRVHALDSCDLLLVALLHCLWPSSTVCCCNYRASRYHAYYEASLIKVVRVFVLDAVLSLRILY